MKIESTHSAARAHSIDGGTHLPERCRDWSPLVQPSFLVPCLAAVVIMFVLKRHYSTASADQLRWILQPVGWLVAGWDDLPYAWQSGIGLVRLDRMITIAPACAGVNFLIMAYGLAVFAFLHHQRTLMRRILWLAGAFMVAFGLSVVVNALRIILSIVLYEAAFEWGWLTPERLHIIAGIAIYSSALGLYYVTLHRIIAGNGYDFRPLRRLWLPWTWYISGAVAVPAIHRAWLGQGWPGLEYCLTVVGVSAFIYGATRWGLKSLSRAAVTPQH